MSAILGVFGAGIPRDEAAVRTLLSPMVRRGAEFIDVWADGAAVLAVSRFDWESRSTCSGGAGVVVEGDLVVAADASLYYREDLRRALGGAGVEAGPTASHLILAAWRAWGAEGMHRLEGDFAFVLYDRATRTVACARDFGGRRPLFYSDRGATLVVASTIGAVRAHPDVSDELNVAVIGEMAGGLLSEAHETVFSEVHCLRSGWLLTRRSGQTSVARFWAPPAVDAAGATPFEEGAEELRELLVQAVAERVDADGATSVWLSGGWDSPAVFAAGEEFFRRRGRGEALQAVSISYPEGDSGREDELIQSVLDRMKRSTHWIDIADIPFLVEPEAAAVERDEPFAHMFEHWLRALSRGSRAEGAHVALDGAGGDQLFSATPLYLADLVRRGRWREFQREWSATGLNRGGARLLFEVVIHPLLPAWSRSLAEQLRPARFWGTPFDPHVPDWIDRGFVRRHGLVERARANAPRPPGSALADAEFAFHIVHPSGSRTACAAASYALEEGVEVRGPLYDGRLVEFAARRPRTERATGREQKRLLRQACAPWLPREFLAARARKTGTTTSYAHRALRRTHAPVIAEVLRAPLLAELGVVRREVLAARWHEFLNGVTRHALPLYTTFQTELWLRARLMPQADRTAVQDVAAAAYA